MLVYDEGFWNSVGTDEKYRHLREAVCGLHGEWTAKPLLPLSYSKFKLYFETGDRKIFGDAYFDRRRQLEAAAVMYLIYKREEYLLQLEDVMWAICDEYSWSLPAHIHATDVEGRIKTIDLFASETSFSLSEIVALIGEALSEEVRSRVKYEIDRRIIRPFLDKKWGWEESQTNWAAVCACQVGGTFLYMAPELFPKVRERISNTMDSFLSGFGNDGACIEGISYWIYGFGLFTIYQELLSGIDPNALDIFKTEKVKNIAMFFQKTFLKGGISITFADSQPQALYDIALSHYLKRIYKDEFKVPPFKYHLPLKRINRFSSFVRAFLYYDPKDNADDFEYSDAYFEDAQWFVRQNESYSFAAKGGHNAEWHNHNDVGSFLVCVNEKQVLCDIGVGLYTRKYFQHENGRYEILCNRSKGHSVPIINGREQLHGGCYAAKDVICDKNKFSLDILGAYEEDGSLIRSFETLDKNIIITDTYNLTKEPCSITERLVSFEKPQIKRGEIIWDKVKLFYSADMLNVEVTEDYHESNFYDGSVYLIDFQVKLPRKEMSVTLNLQFQ
ncbi:MAG: heparinase II/III-family protein [Firmicutes bacterium]|nr:heparinase II/III-family protein [Bacillota bacterium]